MPFVPDQPRFVPDDEPSGVRKVLDRHPLAAAAETALALGSGAVAAPVAGIAGLVQGAKNLVSPGAPAGDMVRKVMGGLSYRPRTAGGQAATEAVAYPFEKLAEGAEAAGGAVADATGSPAAGAAVNTAIQAAPLAISPVARAAGLGAPESAAALAARAKATAANASRDAGLRLARQEGLRVPPSQAETGWILRTLEGLAGEPKTAKLVSKKNAPLINSLIRRDVGLPDDVPLSREALAGIRKQEGAAYDGVKGLGKITPDAKYFDDFAEITKAYDTAAKDFSHRSENPFKRTLEGLTKDADGNPKAGFDAASLVEEVKLLRSDADKAYRQGDPGLGRAFKSAAQALDDALDRHAQQIADPSKTGMVRDYQAARTRIAKTYAADKALGEGGNINAAVYAKALKTGKPLSGEAEKVAKFAAQFPRSAQRVETLGSTGPTLFDFGMGAIGGSTALLDPLGGALALAASRPVVRQALTARPPSVPGYGPSTLSRRLSDPALAAAVQATPIAGIPAGQSRLSDLLRKTQ